MAQMDDKNTEMWADVSGTVGRYQVSTHGRVKSLDMLIKHPKSGMVIRKGKILSQRPDKAGYMCVCLTIDNAPSQRLVHRLVAMSFLQQDTNKIQVNHIDLCKWNNMVSNLEWVTPSENIVHAVSAGKFNSRTNQKRQFVLNEKKVEEIKYLAVLRYTQRQISELVGVSQSHISRLLIGKTWQLPAGA